tara:strand:+ start:196 stop:522 length:327 start_codon:yes stop_codon:yes gene_type:complete
MKKLLFVLVFAFIGQQVFSQMYIVTASTVDANHPSGCYTGGSPHDGILTTIDPLGNMTYECLPHIDDTEYGGQNLAVINLKLNSIIDLGYKLFIPSDNGGSAGNRGIW